MNVLKRLQKYFYLYHISYPFGPYYLKERGGYLLPEVLEVGFINKNLIKDRSKVRYSAHRFPMSTMDNHGFNEYFSVMTYWPFDTSYK